MTPTDPDPSARNFRRLYALVLAVLAAEIVVFWLVTRAFS
jgi:hypothetical protein